MRVTDSFTREDVALYIEAFGFVRIQNVIETYTGRLYDDNGRQYVAFFRKSGESTFALFEAI